MSVRRLVMCLLLALPPLAGAQTTDPATRELIERLLARIDTLEKRVAQLENPATRRRGAGSAALRPPAGASRARPRYGADARCGAALLSLAQASRVQRFQFRRHGLAWALGRIRHADAAGAAHRVSGRPVRAAHEFGALAQGQRVRRTEHDGARRCGHRVARRPRASTPNSSA